MCKNKKTIRTRCAMLVVVVSFVLLLCAWGPDRPTYTLDEINDGNLGDNIVFNSIRDNPSIGDERNFVTARKRGSEKGFWYDDIVVERDATYIIRLYVHNNSPYGLSSVAEGVRVMFDVPSVVGEKIEVNGFITCDNSKPNEYYDLVTFTSDEEFALEYISGSAWFENNGFAPNGKPLDEKKDYDIVTSRGAMLGYDLLDGKIPGCFQYSGYVSILVKPIFVTNKNVETERLIETDFLVRKNTEDWSENIEVSAGDNIECKIDYRNIGNTPLYDIIMKLNMPDYISLDFSSLLIDENASDWNWRTRNNAPEEGLNIGSCATGMSGTVQFSAFVNSHIAELGDDNPLFELKAVVDDTEMDSDTVFLTMRKLDIGESSAPVINNYGNYVAGDNNGEMNVKSEASKSSITTWIAVIVSILGLLFGTGWIKREAIKKWCDEMKNRKR